eukprot:760157-Ditylum_brightwellii.AAC.1
MLFREAKGKLNQAMKRWKASGNGARNKKKNKETDGDIYLSGIYYNNEDTNLLETVNDDWWDFCRSINVRDFLSVTKKGGCE